MSPKRVFALCLCLGLGVVLGAACSDDDNDDDGKKDAGLPDAKLDQKVPDKGKPDMDPKKKPKIISMLPDNGFSNGGKAGTGTPMVFKGENFSKPATVYLDGKPQSTYPVVNSNVSISFLMPPNPDDKTKAQKVSVQLYMGGQFSNIVDFQYHVTKQMTDDFKGQIITKTGEAYADFASGFYEAKVYYKGITDVGAKRSTKLKVEIGYGTVGKDPSNQPGFKWAKASWKKVDGKYHVYESTIKVPLVQTYDVAFRFSHDKDGFGTFGDYVYADTDESDKKYSTASAAKIKATQAPVDYCLANADCVTSGQKTTCKTNSNKKLNRCVQCLVASDCTKFKYAYGPKCKSNTCYCTAAADCKGNPNGYVCTQSHCGCTKDTNCPVGTKCYKPGLCQ